jgi:hypothetical protein
VNHLAVGALLREGLAVHPLVELPLLIGDDLLEQLEVEAGSVFAFVLRPVGAFFAQSHEYGLKI